MSQQNIDFGTFPNDPDADAIRTAFQKVQENFNTLFDASSNQTVTSVNQATGAGITVNSPFGNVVVSARIACVQIQTSTLGLGSGSGNTANLAIITDGSTPFIIDLPSTINNVANINLSGTLTANTVNVNLQINGNVGNFSGNLSAANLNSSGVLNITGNANVGNLGATTGVFAGNVTATFFLGDGSLLTNVATAGTVTTNAQPNITSVGTLTGLDVNGDITATNITANTGVFTGNGAGLSQITGANVTGTVSAATTADSATTAGTVTTNAQPNITSVGSLSSLDVTGNIISGNANLGNLATANFFQGDGGLLSNVFGTTSNSITSGNSNVSIPTANGDVNISVSGTANILVITSAGANITGDANISGNLVANNLSASLITGVLTNAAQPNITSVGTLNGLTVGGLTDLGPNGNITITGGSANQFLISNGSGGLQWLTLANLVAAPGSNTYVTYNDAGNVAGAAGLTYDKITGAVTVSANIVAGNVYANSGTVGASLLTGTLTTAAQPNVTSIGSLSSLIVTGNINTNNLSVSNYANSKFVSVVSGSLTSNIPVFNANQIWNNASVVFKAISVDITDTASDVNSSLIDLQTNTVSKFSVDKSGNVAFSGVATGNGAGLSAIAGANVTGTVSAATTAGTVTTAAQPNITSVGTLSSLGVSGTVTASKFTSNVATGTAPFTVSSNTRVANLNVDLLDGSQPSALATANTIVLRNTDGNITGNFFIGNGSQLSGLPSGTGITNGNSNVNIPSANGNVNISAAGVANVLVVTGTGINVTGNANVGNLGTAQVLATANITAPRFISNIATGTSPLTVTSTTRVANLNVDYLDGYQPSSSATANTVVARDSSGNITGNFFIGDGSLLSGLPFGTGISNGNSNVNIPSANGNVNISAVGVANVLVVTGTGANIAGTLNATGNANVGNLNTAQVLATANVTAPIFISNIATGTAPLVVSSTTRVANLNVDYLDGYQPSSSATANTVVVRNTDGNITGNFFIGNGSQLSGLPSGTGITNGNSNVSIPSANGNVNISAVGVANVLVVTGTGINVTGNANVGNLGTAQVLATANITAPQLISNVATGTAPLVVSSTTQVANLNVATAGTVTTNAQPNITSVGTLSSLAVTGNITSGNVYANSGTVGASLLTGTLTTAAQSNITSVGTLSSLAVTANANANNFNATNSVVANSFTSNIATGTAPFIVSSTTQVANLSVATAGSATTAGTVTTNAQANITSVGTLSSLAVTGNANANNFNATNSVVASTLTSNVATGTAPLTVTSTTRVSNLSVSYANVSDFGVVTAQTTGTYYPIFANGSSSGNYAHAANSSFSANLANGGLTATTFVGNLSGNLSGNISGNSTVSGKLTLAGNSSTLATLLTNASEPATITATAATGTINFYPTTQSVLYYTSNASDNWTVNFAASSGTTMDSALSTGQTLTVAFLVKQGATSYYANNHTVDGVTGVVTMLWQGGTAPTSGDNNSTDVYTYTLIKTASNAYTILASQTQFA